MSKNYKIKRYGSIYGPSRKRSIINGALTAVAVIVLFGSAWLLYEPVVNFVKELQNPTPLPPISVSGADSSQSQSGSASEDPSTPVTKPVTKELSNLAYMPTNILLNKELFEKSVVTLKDSGVQGIVFDVKDPQGIVLYQSALPKVAEAKAQSPQAFNLSDITSRITESGMIPVARVYTFRDKTAPKSIPEASVKYDGTEFNWIDNAVENGGKLWLNPYSKDAQDYNLTIINECMDLGVKSVVLDGVQFPTGFSLDKAYYGEEAKAIAKSKVLLDFANSAKNAVTSKNKEGICWLMLPGASLALKDTSPLSPFGGDITGLASYSDLMVDFMQSSLGGTDIILKQLGIVSTSPTSTEIVEAIANTVGSGSGMGKVTPVLQTSSVNGSPEPAKVDIDSQLQALKGKNMANGYLLWSINGNYDLLK